MQLNLKKIQHFLLDGKWYWEGFNNWFFFYDNKGLTDQAKINKNHEKKITKDFDHREGFDNWIWPSIKCFKNFLGVKIG